MESNTPHSDQEVHLSVKELTQLFQEIELKNLHTIFLERLALLFIAGFGLITALAWEEALKITFHELFSEVSPFGQRFLYPILITIFTVLISVLISKLVLKKNKK